MLNLIVSRCSMDAVVSSLNGRPQDRRDLARTNTVKSTKVQDTYVFCAREVVQQCSRETHPVLIEFQSSDNLRSLLYRLVKNTTSKLEETA